MRCSRLTPEGYCERLRHWQAFRGTAAPPSRPSPRPLHARWIRSCSCCRCCCCCFCPSSSLPHLSITRPASCAFPGGGLSLWPSMGSRSKSWGRSDSSRLSLASPALPLTFLLLPLSLSLLSLLFLSSP